MEPAREMGSLSHLSAGLAGLCAPGASTQDREQGRNMERSSEVDCEWLRRLEVTKIKLRNKVQIPSCPIEFPQVNLKFNTELCTGQSKGYYPLCCKMRSVQKAKIMLNV